MALLLKHEDIVGLLTIDETIDAVRAGLHEQARGQVQVPGRTTIDSTSKRGWLRLMPGILNESGVMGFKAMHSTPGIGVRYLVMLYELATGKLLAAMDADWLTSERTAATGAIGADVLARKEIECVGVLGSSEQACAMLRAIAQVRKFPRVKVFSPTQQNRERFARKMGEQLHTSIVAVDSAEKAVVGSDLVLSMFRTGTTPIVMSDWVGPGTHVNAASSVRPEARELEDTIWRRCSVVVVDDREHAFESGDGRSALSCGAASREKTAELWELIGSRRSGRQSAADITLFKFVGTALQDLSIAFAIYRRAVERGLGVDIGDFPHIR